MDNKRLVRLRKMLEQVDPSRQFKALKESLESRTAVASEGPQLEVRRTAVDPRRLEAEMTLESLDLLERGRDEAIDTERQFVLEAIVMPYHRPVVDIVDDRMQLSQLTTTWQGLGADDLRPRIEDCLLSIGRIDVPNILYAGTGFIVGPDLLMTNRHVAAIFATGVGTRTVHFQSGQTAAIDFYHETGRAASESLTVEDVLMIHPYWDLALLKVRGLPPNRKPLALSTADPATLLERQVVTVGYPGYDPYGDDEFQRIQNRVFRGTYYVKRLQPGLVKPRGPVASYQRMVDAITHDCSTLGGNSGSTMLLVPDAADAPVQVIALHFAGQYLVANYAVPTYDLAQDSRVVGAGVNFQGRVEPRGDFYGPIWRQIEASESPPPVPPSPGSMTGQAPPPSGTPHPPMSWTIPLRISVTLGTPILSPAELPGSTVTGQVRIAPTPVEGLFSHPTAPTVPDTAFSLAALSATRFDWRAALSTALASRLSYEDACTIQKVVEKTWRFQSCEFREADDTQCFVALSDRVVLLAFRGTESLGDWLSNLDTFSTPRPYGRVHRGFLAAFQIVEEELRTILSNLQGRPLLLTGHSLGGAIATIAAAEWSGQIPIAWLYTFGQPAVGKGEFPAFMGQRYAGNFFRFVNDDDIVPRVPPTYQHVGRLLHFDAQGQVQSGTESPARASSAIGMEPAMLTEEEFDRLRAHLLLQRAQSRSTGTEALAGPALEGFLPSISDHSLDCYLAKIKAKAGV